MKIGKVKFYKPDWFPDTNHDKRPFWLWLTVVKAAVTKPSYGLHFWLYFGDKAILFAVYFDRRSAIEGK